MSTETDMEPSLAEAVTRVVGGKAALNFFTHLHEETGFLYFSAPAVANTRTIGSLNMAVADTMGMDYSIAGTGQLFNRQANIVGNPNIVGYNVFEQMLEDPDVVRFTFLRDPADRFAMFYRHHFSISVKNAEPRKKLFDHLGMSLEQNLTMHDLAQLLLDDPELKGQMSQFRDQRQMTAFDLVDYHFIGTHEEWSRDFAKISTDIFGREVGQFDPIAVFNKDPEGVNTTNFIEAQTNELLAQLYVEDYEMLEEVAELFPSGFFQQT